MSKNYEKKTKKKSKSKSKDKEKKKKSNYTFQSFNYYISKSIIQTNPQSKSITYRESKSKSKSK